VTLASSAFHFHHVPVALSGAPELVACFGSALAIDIPFSAAAVSESRAIRIHLRSDVVARATTEELSVHAGSSASVVVVAESSIEAEVDLATLAIEVRGCTPAVPTRTSAQMRVVVGALLLALRELGIVQLHAAAVVHGDRAIILAGDSGAGKTTTALALVEAGCAPLTDDQIFVRDQAGEWELLSAPQAFRVTPRTLRAFAAFESARGPLLPDLEKYELRLHDMHASPHRERYHGSVRVLFPRQDPARLTRIVPMTHAEALGELMVASPAVAIGGAERARAHAAVLGKLVRSAGPCWLRLGPELLEHPANAGRRILSLLHEARL
jgi:hypothetical protein